MRELPILFSAPMVRAILDGRKTVTRRIIKSIPWRPGVNPNFSQARAFSNGGVFCIAGSAEMTTGFRCPYGMPGDRLWVRETTVNVEDHGYIGPVFAASDEGCAIREGGLGPAEDDCEIEPEDIKLRSALHMPKAWARLWLEVTAVRVERLKQITERQAMAEGIDGEALFRAQGWSPLAFERLWESINGTGSWAANPWVWVVEFKRVEAEVPHAG